MSRSLALALALAALGCAESRTPRAPVAESAFSAARRSPHPVRLGVAVVDSQARWCAMFTAADTLPVARPGDRVTIIWVDSTTERASGAGRVVRVRPGACSTQGVGSQLAYELVLDDTVSVAERPAVAHAVVGESAWRFGPRGWAYGDVDGDGVEEIARGCTSQEGYHLTLWRQRPGTVPTLDAHYYHYLGYDVIPSCTEEETREVR